MNSLTVTPAGAAGAYARIQDGSGAVAGADAGAGFGAALARAVGGVVEAGKDADAKTAAAITGTGGSVTEVVTAVTKAELALQGATAIRDRVVQAYQDIMRMPI